MTLLRVKKRKRKVRRREVTFINASYMTPLTLDEQIVFDEFFDRVRRARNGQLNINNILNA